MERKEAFKVLEKIDAEITNSGIFEALEEDEACQAWEAMMYKKAEEAGIRKYVKAYLEEVYL